MVENQFVPIMIVILAAAAVPFLTSRLRFVRIPVVVGEIVLGMIIGRSGFNLVHESLYIDILNNLGVAYLMFLVGLEVDFSIISRNKAKCNSRLGLEDPLITGIIIYAVTMAIGGAASIFLYSLGMITNVFLMAVLLSTTAPIIVVATLRETGLIKTEYGQYIFSAAVIADLAAVILLAFAISEVTNLSNVLASFVLLFAIFIGIYRSTKLLILKQIHKSIFNRVPKASEILVRLSFGLIFVFVAISEAIGVEYILGAFFAGLTISLLSTPELMGTLHHKLLSFGYGFFIPIFFIVAGTKFELFSLTADVNALMLLPIFVLIGYANKTLPSFFLLPKRFGVAKRMSGGIFLASRLGLLIAIAFIALDKGAISGSMYSALILLAIITSIASPIIFFRILGKEERLV